MERTSAIVKAAFLSAAFALCFTSVAASGDSDGHDLCPAADMTSGPVIADSLVTSYISVDGDGIVACGMQYSVPANSTLYQGMLAASQQQGNTFTFTSQVYPVYGHLIDSIDDVAPMGGFYWFIFDKATLMTTPVGVDFIRMTDDSSYIWHYANSTDHNQTYTGLCEGAFVIYPSEPLTYKVGYLSVSSPNIGDSFKSVCKQPVLIPPSSTTAFTLLEIANDQIPISIQAVVDMQNNTVTSLNGLANSGSYIWTGYRAGTNQPLSYDLAMTAVSDGDHIEFRLIGDGTEETPQPTEDPSDSTMEAPGGGAPSAGKPAALLSVGILLARVMTSM